MKIAKSIVPRPLIEYISYRRRAQFVRDYRSRRETEIARWIAEGKRGNPPHAVKQDYVRKYAKEFDARILVETGTYLGQMIYAMKDDFEALVSIELSEELHGNAVRLFKRYRNVKIVQGDSGKILLSVLEGIHQTCLFWLDGHSSEGITKKGESSTPIVGEIGFIKEHATRNGIEHVILIDDARNFNGTDDYPRIDVFENLVKALFPDYAFEIHDDIIAIHK